jgi:hypothetical protein
MPDRSAPRPTASLTARQLDLIAKLAALDPPPWFIGGYAEDALLAGAVTRPHENWMRVHKLTFGVGGEDAEEELLSPSEPLA